MFGVIEIFYGQPWDWGERIKLAPFLQQTGFQFYIYGPKSDDRLRKNWSHRFSPNEMNALRTMRDAFVQCGLKFGIVLSPFALFTNFDLRSRTLLSEKISQLNELELDFLGLFFDDMRNSEHLAHHQREILEFTSSQTSSKIIFSPTYYSDDPLLDLFFGQRPESYLEQFRNLPSQIEVLWTGDKIISESITISHLLEVQDRIGRKPFICDNYFANDGPINCNFLKTVPFIGRDRETFKLSSGWALNPMNQVHLSKLALSSFMNFARANHAASDDTTAAFVKALESHCHPSTIEILMTHGRYFAEVGLSEISDAEKAKLREILRASYGPIETEIIQWLDGTYNVELDSVLA